MATVRQLTTFTVTAHDFDGQPRTEGGDTFFVAIRGASRVRAKVTDNVGPATSSTTVKFWTNPWKAAFTKLTIRARDPLRRL